MAEEHKKIKHPVCPKCGKPMRIIAPINMAVCDECGEKYYIERQGDEYVVLGKYYEVKAKKVKEEEKKEETDWLSAKGEEPKEKEESKEGEKNKVEENKEEEIPPPPPIIPAEDTRTSQFREYVDRYVNRKYWIQVAKDELKSIVSELYDAGALGNNFNPAKVARLLTNMNNNTILPFYGVGWLDKAVTKELLTRIWLKLQGYKEVMKVEKLKYYIAIFHPDEMEEFLNGKMSEIKVKKYIYEMEAIEE